MRYPEEISRGMDPWSRDPAGDEVEMPGTPGPAGSRFPTVLPYITAYSDPHNTQALFMNLRTHLPAALAMLLIPLTQSPGQATFSRFFLDRTMRVDYHHFGTKDKEQITLDKVYEEGPWPGSTVNLVDTLGLLRIEHSRREAHVHRLRLARDRAERITDLVLHLAWLQPPEELADGSVRLPE